MQTSGELTRQTLVWREGLEDWIPIAALDVRGRATPPPPPPPTQVIPPPLVAAPGSIGSPSTTIDHHRAAARKPERLNQTPGWVLAIVLVVFAVGAVTLGAAGQWWLSRSSVWTAADPSVAANLEPAAPESGAHAPGVQRSAAAQPPADIDRATSGDSTDAFDSSTAGSDSNAEPDSLAADASGSVGDGTTGPTATPSPVSTVPEAAGPDKEPDPQPVSVPEPRPNPEPVTLSPDYVVFQEIQVQRTPQFSIAGTVMGQDLKYKLLSELSVSSPDERGIRTVAQVIRGARLVSADEMSKASFEKSLRDIEGWQFTARVNRFGEVVDWKAGPKDGKAILEVNPLDLSGFLVTSVMDDDGWKELTQLAFFAPDPKVAPEASWSRQMTHDYGPLGRWSGITRFQKSGEQEGIVRYDYRHEMEYHPPEKDAGVLPFKILDARFTPQIAGGRIYLDSRSQRVTGAEETFLLRGVISAEVLGQVAVVETLEQQTLVVKMTSENPWKVPE